MSFFFYKSIHFYNRASDFYLVNINGSEYSVPYKLVGKYVEAQISDRRVVIMYKGKEVARHPINIHRDEPLINYEHMPEHHRAVHNKRRKYEHPEEILQDAERFGQYVKKYCSGLLQKYGMEGKETCIAIINLCRRSAPEDLPLISEALRAVTDEDISKWNYHNFVQKFKEL